MIRNKIENRFVKVEVGMSEERKIKESRNSEIRGINMCRKINQKKKVGREKNFFVCLF